MNLSYTNQYCCVRMTAKSFFSLSFLVALIIIMSIRMLILFCSLTCFDRCNSSTLWSNGIYSDIAKNNSQIVRSITHGNWMSHCKRSKQCRACDQRVISFSPIFVVCFHICMVSFITKYYVAMATHFILVSNCFLSRAIHPIVDIIQYTIEQNKKRFGEICARFM